ncbi:hypothetical protein SERLA73DRAFT_189372 [Serpula lacrymans var. lacrymans S7.3]|uniref:Uncharacterized protein n=2 Tax=Serpula lacrymans var. lacrymans TaxID=341189 RepID=F8QDH0_SERL3|nr:uncharacterized protein SERLADRAFT_480155 [Serpula lacrymans var. lacrymans S7.9]EGN93641.1 hypothetical protein SERLA73DRAFT_189372 [Serpula lacrymans var. lacrymans S7.3]EGO19018.1 hypothetical protein SERLADRAFT_480155 [Serpula lacrymans var. lacrymans S7.9]
MSTFVRNLVIRTVDLGVDVTLLLAFDKDLEGGIYKDYFPVVWRVTPFGAKGPFALRATYTSQLTFLKPQVANNNIIGAETYTDISYNESTTLTKSGGVFYFSPPTTGKENYMVALNDTGSPQDIAIGFKDGGDPWPKPALYFNNVGQNSNVTAQFTPILRAYITSDYQETDILRGAIQTKAIWEVNLAELRETTTWNLSREPHTGIFKITPA